VPKSGLARHIGGPQGKIVGGPLPARPQTYKYHFYL